MSMRTVARARKTVDVSCGQVLRQGGLGPVAAMCQDGTNCRNRGTYMLIQEGYVVYHCAHHEDRAEEILEGIVFRDED